MIATKDDPTSSHQLASNLALSKAVMMEEALTSSSSNLTNRNLFLKRQLPVPFPTGSEGFASISLSNYVSRILDYSSEKPLVWSGFW